MIGPQAKFIAHTSIALVIGRCIHDDWDYSTFNKLATTADQKVILAEFDLTSLLPQPNQTTRAGKQDGNRMGILWSAGDKEGLSDPRSRRECDDFLGHNHSVDERQKHRRDAGPKHKAPGR